MSAVERPVEKPETELASSDQAVLTESPWPRVEALLEQGRLEPALSALSVEIRTAPSAYLHYARALVPLDLDRLAEASRDLAITLEMADEWIVRRSVQRLYDQFSAHLPWGDTSPTFRRLRNIASPQMR